MSPDKIAYFKKLLERKRHEFVSGGDQKAEPTHQENERPDDDMQPLAEMSQVIASSRNQGRSDTIDAIEECLATIQKCPKDYGLCESCEESIPPKRLEIMPWASLCVKCQSQEEVRSRGVTRNNLTDYVT